MSKTTDVNKVGDGGNANVPTSTDPADQQQQQQQQQQADAAVVNANLNATTDGGDAGGVGDDDQQADEAGGEHLDDSRNWDGEYFTTEDLDAAFPEHAQRPPGAREGFVAIQKGGYAANYDLVDHIKMLNMALPDPVPLSNNPTMVEIIKAGNRTLERIAAMRKHAQSEAGSEDTFYGSTPKPETGHMTRRQAALLKYKPPPAAELDARLKQRRLKRYLFEQADALQDRLDPILRDPAVFTAQKWSDGANADDMGDVDQEVMDLQLDSTQQTVIENVVDDTMDVHDDGDEDLASLASQAHGRQGGSVVSFILDSADPNALDREKSDQFRTTMALRHSAKATTKAIVEFLKKFLQQVADRQLSMQEYNVLRDRRAKLLAAQEQWSDYMASAASLAPFHQHYIRFPQRLDAWLTQENMDFVELDVQVDMQLQEMDRLIQYHEKYAMGGALLNVTPLALETPSPFKPGAKNPQRLTTLFNATAGSPAQGEEKGEPSKHRSPQQHQRPRQLDELQDQAKTAPAGAAAAAVPFSFVTPNLPPKQTGDDLRRRALRFRDPPVRPAWADQLVTPPPMTGGVDVALLRSDEGQLQGQQQDLTVAPVMVTHPPPRPVFDSPEPGGDVWCYKNGSSHRSRH